MNKKITIIILVQLVFICFLSIYLIARIRSTHMSPLEAVNYPARSQGNLKYFYEPANFPFDEPYPWDPTKKIMYTMNKDTVRSNRDYAVPKPPNTLRIITIGDSFTFGQFVKDDETYPAQLEALLEEKLKDKYDNVEVINLGVPGYDVEYAAVRLYKRGIKYNPDYILWLITDDDFPQNNEKELAYIDFYKKTLSEEEVNIYKNNGIYYPYHELARKKVRSPELLKNSIQRNIGLIDQLSEKYGSKLIVLVPKKTKYKYLDLIKNSSIQFNFRILYLSDIYTHKRMYLPDSHPNKAGYSLYVQDIAAAELIK